MAQTLTERVTGLERVVEAHGVRLGALDKELDASNKRHAEVAKALALLKPNFDLTVALLKREVEELSKWRDEVKKSEEEWGRKLWMILPPVLAVLVSNALTFAIAFYVKK